jgi:long-subunit acyl-CoA synthetase (AMP-forming)
MSELLLPLDYFYHFEKNQSDRVYLKQPLKGQWIDLTWGEVGREARKLAHAIKNMNLPEKSNIAILSKNCAHWVITDLAIWMAGHVSVPLYPTLNADSINYILEHSEAKLIFVGKLDEWMVQKSGVPETLKKVHYPHWRNEGSESWESFIGDLSPLQQTSVPKKEDLCTIIYTSGTTGNPKGVVHTFNSASTHIRQALTKLTLTSSDRFFSYLPLSHVAERLLVEMGSIYSGGTVYFAESLDSFKDNLVFAQPTVFLAVPRIWLKFQQGILGKIPQKKLSLLLSIPLINLLIKKKLKKALGLNKVRYPVTGAAAISKEILEWFDKIGIPILEAYGMTENFGVSNLNLPEAKRYGTVGKPFKPNTEVKISEDGEILAKSEAIMLGYYKDPDKTKEMIDTQGWLHTGDKGEFDQDGFLKVTGRVKDAFKTTKGKYVTPTKIEGLFEMCEVIEHVCVMGSGLPAPIAVVILNESGKKMEKESIHLHLKTTLDHVNKTVENYEVLSHVVVIQDEWSVANGILTPTLKLKRNVVEKKYSQDLITWSNHGGKIIIS